jgi:phosphate acetyltransferase
MGSAHHALVEKVQKAYEIAHQSEPNLKIDGELQADAAIVEKVGKQKAPNSKVAGKANVLIFPDLNAGNIGYKLVQRFAGYEAVGPILQGMRKPIHDLSRGCSVEDVVNLTVIAALQVK